MTKAETQRNNRLSLQSDVNWVIMVKNFYVVLCKNFLYMQFDIPEKTLLEISEKFQC